MSCVQIDAGPCFAASEQESLLKAALRAGVGFPYECHSGGCGACKFDLLEGEVETLWPDAPGLSARERQRGKKLACQSLPRGDLRIKVRPSPEYIPFVNPRRFQAKFTAARQLTHDMAEFSFKAEGAADFLPGQYSLLTLPELGLQRAYSMSNLKNGEGHWKFIVRSVAGGVVSQYLFNKLSPGATVELDGPYGMAWMRPLDRDLICIAGGSGLAPMLSIAYAATPLLEESGRKLHFYFGARTTKDLVAQRQLETLRSQSGRLECVEVVSQPIEGDGWAGPTGFVHQEVKRTFGDTLPGHEVYFAGPPPMAQALLDLLMVESGVPYSQIHFDRFF